MLQDQVEVKVAIDKLAAHESVAQSMPDGDTGKKAKPKEQKVQIS